jgi:membrane-associated phospholipid phosphatase
MVAIAALALALPAGHVRDAAILHGFVDLYSHSRYPLLKAMADMADPLPYLAIGGVLVTVAFVRGLRWRALAVVALLVVPAVTTQAFKHLLAEPRVLDWLNNSPSEASWPSGHATAAMTLALCAVLVTPRRFRGFAVLGGGVFAVAVGYAVLVMHWHYPSDVLGG